MIRLVRPEFAQAVELYICAVISFLTSAMYLTVTHQSHDPCSRKYMEARVMTLVAHCT